MRAGPKLSSMFDSGVPCEEIAWISGDLREPAQPFVISRIGGRQDLDGDLASELRVARAVDLAHASGADGAEDLELAKPAAGAG